MNRRFRQAKKLLSAATIGAVLATTVPAANAAVGAGRAIEVFYGREFVGLSGYQPNSQLRVDVLRGGNVVIGSVTTTTDADGNLEVNHLGGGQFADGGDCWAPPVSPNIMPGDTIRAIGVSANGTSIVDDTTTRDIWFDRTATTITNIDGPNSTITMKGRVRSLASAPIDKAADILELRLRRASGT